MHVRGLQLLAKHSEHNFCRSKAIESHHVLQKRVQRHISRAPHSHVCTGNMPPPQFRPSPCKMQALVDGARHVLALEQLDINNSRSL